MGVDIMFYKSNKKTFDQTVKQFDGDENINWEELSEYEINYARGRHLIFEYITEHFGSLECGELSPQNIKELCSKAENIVNKWRTHTNEMCTIPVVLLEKYLKEAKENDKQTVTLPLSDYADDEEFVDEWDYYQALDILETNWDKKADEVIWFINSY